MHAQVGTGTNYRGSGSSFGFTERGNAAGEVCLLGGTAMALGFKARPSTKDIDAIFAPAGLIRELAAIVQQEQNLPENWINDSAKGFISAQHETVVGDLPQFENLRLT